jgi:hypothetical protein
MDASPPRRPTERGDEAPLSLLDAVDTADDRGLPPHVPRAADARPTRAAHAARYADNVPGASDAFVGFSASLEHTPEGCAVG